MKNRGYILLMASIFIPLMAAGCGGKKPASGGERLLAKVNKCDITVEDFQNDARMIISGKRDAKDVERAKEELLDEIIVKKMLLQEAQARNFDKDKAFMKEIERYWEQALLKRLIKQKMQELLTKISISDDEMAKEYERMKAEPGKSAMPFEKAAPYIRSDIKRRKVADAFSKWIATLKDRAAIKVYRENLKYVVID